MLKEYGNMKKEIRNLKLLIESFSLFIKQCYCIVWSVEKNTESKNPKVWNTKKERIILLSKCEACDKKSEFIKEQEGSRLLISLGMKAPLSKIPFVGPLLF